jgi:uncharacterized membrane protein
VNAGMNLSYGLMALLFAEYNIPATNGTKWLMVSMYSTILFLANLSFIYLTALLFFKVRRFY